MFEFFRRLFSTDFFMPHGMCFAWDPAVLWLNVISDSLIAASYYAIPFLLFYFVKKRRDVAFKPIFIAFGAFILACGTTHLLGAVMVWTPAYRLDGLVKAVTAAASAATFAMLIPMMPALVKLPSPAEMAGVNGALEKEIGERRAVEGEVRRMNAELELRVAGRTAELAESVAMQKRAADSLRLANDDLQREMQRRHEVEDQLIQAQKMEAVGRLAGGVAHDFNNLLTAILGYTELLRGQVEQDPDALEYAAEVRRAAERASNLTNQLLAFSRRQPAAPQVVDLNQVVRQIDKMLRRIIGEDIDLNVSLAPDLWPVMVDPAHMDQVIMNLAVNSRDAMPDGGKLTIETANVQLTEEYAAGHLGARPGQYVMMAVSDTGIGMDTATQARVFEPFYTTKEQGKGTGLGLSIVYGIVKQNAGGIMVYSEPAHGTVFKIYIPAVEAPVPAAPADFEDREAKPSEAAILLVEDEDQVRRLARAFLERRGYHVVEAASGPEALKMLQDYAGHIDLLLTDMVMPQMNGAALAERVRALRPEIRILFMSGYTEGGVESHGLLAGESLFLQKPFSASTLDQKVREALRG
jgi:two-component system cell cycle sensor histidine kinase/response regulator CckA